MVSTLFNEEENRSVEKRNTSKLIELCAQGTITWKTIFLITMLFYSDSVLMIMDISVRWTIGTDQPCAPKSNKEFTSIL